jgi:hypothetical protein
LRHAEAERFIRGWTSPWLIRQTVGMTNKTIASAASVTAFLDGTLPERRCREARALDTLFRATTGFEPRMWGRSIVGYGRYHYRYDSGREGDFMATGFSPRKAALSIYILPGYADFGVILNDLGKHRVGKSCLYINHLTDVDQDVLAQLIRAGLDDLRSRWAVFPI